MGGAGCDNWRARGFGVRKRDLNTVQVVGQSVTCFLADEVLWLV